MDSCYECNSDSKRIRAVPTEIRRADFLGGKNPLRYQSFGLKRGESLVLQDTSGGVFIMGHPNYNYTLLYITSNGSYTSLAPTGKNILDAYGVSINVTTDGTNYTLTISRNATGGTEAASTLGIALLI